MQISEMKIPRISGMLLITQRKAMEELVGPGVVTQALAKLPDEVRLGYEAITPLTWFPVEWFNTVVTAVATEVGKDALGFHAEVLRTSGTRTARTIWGMFLRFTSDEALVNRVPVIYARSFSQGELTAKVLGRGRAEVLLSEWPGVPQIQIQGLRTVLGLVLKLAGRDGVAVTVERQPTGALFSVTWHP